MGAARVFLSGLIMSATSVALPAYAAAVGVPALAPRVRAARPPADLPAVSPETRPVYVPTALPPATEANGINSGFRKAASMVCRHLTDMTAFGWNASNGNVVLAGQPLHVKGWPGHGALNSDRTAELLHRRPRKLGLPHLAVALRLRMTRIR